jgi:hypothetical protein
LLLLGYCLLLLLPACQGPSDGQLTLIFPLENTELAGGQSLRVTASLADHDDQPVEGATIQTELRAPSGDVFATRPCTYEGEGRYLADYVRLPTRGTEGTWRVVARATWGDGKQAQAERTFKGLPSLSEKYQSLYGFWIEIPEPDCRNKVHEFRDHLYEDGSGFVILEYNCIGGGHVLMELDVHWQRAEFPTDEAAAIAYTQRLSPPMYHDPNLPNTNLAAERVTFQGRPAWRVTGQWKCTRELAGVLGDGPIEWVTFRCPGSTWLWTIVTSTNEPAAYVGYLQTIRETFECPAPM